jgi:hypothetical protein
MLGHVRSKNFHEAMDGRTNCFSNCDNSFHGNACGPMNQSICDAAIDKPMLFPCHVGGVKCRGRCF